MKFSTIVADPPWNVKAGRDLGEYVVENGRQVWDSSHQKSRDLAYPFMTVDELCLLRIKELAEDNAHLYLWTINKYLPDAFKVAAAWGFIYSTTLVWAKNPMGSGLGGTFGIATEFVLFCRRGSLATKRDWPTTWFNWKRPYDERGKPKHSAKPPAFMEMIEQTSPGPYLELFAREKRPWWSAWGNEVESDVEIPA